MSKPAAKGAEKKAGEEDPKPDTKAEDPTPDQKAEDTKPETAKKEKTFTKAELEAEKQKAIAAEKAKWESEKDLSELERIKKENEELRAANRLRDAKDEVVASLTAAGNKSPELAWNAMRGDLKFDDAGKLINSKDLIEGLKTNFPEQFGTEKPSGTIDGGAGQDSQGSTLTQAQIEKMTPDEINSNWAEVSKVLAASK